jgi:hypothetical protein
MSATVNRTMGERRALVEADDVIPVSGMFGLPATTRSRGSGALVFGGHLADPGVTEELAPGDLAGAAVIVRLSAPAGVDAETTPPRMSMGMLFGPASPASAVLLVADGDQEGLWAHAASVARNGSVELQSANEVVRGGGPAFFLVSPAWVERVLGTSLAEARQPKTGLGIFEYEIAETSESLDAWNIVATMPGSDPRRAGQYVSVGAHYDHVGIGVPVDGDSIYNGADDNASGTAGLLEVAERLASLPRQQRPARSVLFLWYTAEEHGLLGSRSFTDSPTVPRDSIVVNINADMIGRNSPDSIFVVGAGRLSSELAAEVEAANDRLDRPFILDYSYDSPDHPEMIFCRSDHYSFARFGIPIVFFTTGLHDDYHQPSDVPERLNYEKLARVSGMVSDLVLTLANRERRPLIDQPVEQAGAECVGM